MPFVGKVRRGYNILAKPQRDVREEDRSRLSAVVMDAMMIIRWFRSITNALIFLSLFRSSSPPSLHNILFLLDYKVSLPYQRNLVQSVFCFYIYLFAYTSFLSSVLSAYLRSIFLVNALGVCLCSLLHRHNCNAIGKLL